MKALKLTQDLRKAELTAVCDIVGRSVKSQLRYADKIGAKYSVVIGDNEIVNGSAVVKNMSTGEGVDSALDCDSFVSVVRVVT